MAGPTETGPNEVAGYLGAAGGGLSARDLAELTGTTASDIEEWIEELLTVDAGRSLTRRPSSWRPGTAPDVYHADQHADQHAGGAGPDGYRQRLLERLHAWAAGYRDRGWPADTPEYLLDDYFRMLRTIGDTVRMVAHATDADRHDRMLDVTGTDSLATAEIVTALDIIAEQDDPDLAAMCQLAVHRGYLADRNIILPRDLPALWVRLGHPARGEGLAGLIPLPATRAAALRELAQAVAEPGDETGDETGDLDRAEAIARSIPDRDPKDRIMKTRGVRALALAELACAVAKSGDLDRAEAIADSLPDPEERAPALTGLVPVVARAGHPDRARALADRAEAIARLLPEIDQGHPLRRLARAVAEAGDVDRAEAIAGALPYPWIHREPARAELAQTVAEAGDLDRAEGIVRSISDLYHRGEALIGLLAAAGASDAVGDGESGRALADRAEAVARGIPPNYLEEIDEDWQSQSLLVKLSRTVAGYGDLDRAEHIARGLDVHRRASAMAALAEIASRAGDKAGDPDRTARLLDEAETFARSLNSEAERNRNLADVTTAAARCAARGSHLDRAVTIVDSLADPYQRACALAGVASAAADSGHVEQAEIMTRRITHPFWRSRALTAVASATLKAGDPDRARVLAHQAQMVAHSTVSSDPKAVVAEPDPYALADLVWALHQAGDTDHAHALGTSITSSYWQSRALRELAQMVAAAGDPQRSRSIADSITNTYQREQTLADVTHPNAHPAQPEPDPAEAHAPHARRTAADAVRRDGWRTSLPAVGRAEPSAIPIIVDEYLRLMERHPAGDT